MSKGELISPCIGVCALDGADVCMGCYRTGDEITDWFMASDERKHEIIAASEQRMREAQSIRLD
ncbi:MAG: DUF1289 domain-containing protein [Pseudomonadota bacterium]